MEIVYIAILVVSTAILIIVAIFEFQLQRKVKLIKEIEQCLLVSDTESLNRLENILNSKQSKYLTDYERFTYEEYLKLWRKLEET